MVRTFLILNFVALIALSTFVFLRPSRGKTVYVLNNAVFEGFHGKKLLQDKLGVIQRDNKKVLDSLSRLVQASNKREIMEYYQNTASNYRMAEQELSAKYTADIWKRINSYLVEFGKEKGYSFIMGANGNGNVMYADDQLDVTKEAIEYINMKYEAGD